MAALFASLTGILGVLACMRYELSIVLPDNDREAANLLGVSLCFTMLMTLLTTLVVWSVGPQVSRWVGMPELAPYLWLIPIAVLIQGVFTALNYWNTRTKHFTRLSIAQVTSAISSTTATLGAGLVGYATGGAIIAASVSGQAVAATVLGGQIWRDNGRFLAHSIRWREMLAGLNRHKKFPIYSTWTALFNTAGLQLAPLVLVALYGAATAGFYALTLRILSMPSALIGSAVGNVFFSRAPQAFRDGKLPNLIEILHSKLTIVGIPALILLLVTGPHLFSAAFGEQWHKAGQYAQWMAPWIYLQFQWSPLSTLASVLEIQHASLVSQILTLALRAGSLLVCAWIGATADTAVKIFALVSALSYYSTQIWFMKKAGVKPKSIIIHDIKNIILFSLLILPAWFAYLEDSFAFLLGSIIYLSLVLLWWVSRLSKSF